MRVQAAELEALATRILAKAGASVADARTVAGSLVRSDLLGHDSHGVRRLTDYVRRIRTGQIDPLAEPEAEHTRPGTVVVHSRRAFGQLAALCAVRELQDLAPAQGSGVAVLREGNHIGRLGEYVGMLAERDLVGLAFGNGDPTVAPYGGRERRMGTNPLAWAVPRAADRPPVVMDWATSGIAEGKLRVARDKGEHVPEGLVLDAAGLSTTKPADFYQGGALLPFGGHKGYGLSVLIEIVAGLVTGMGIGSMPGFGEGWGTVFVAFDIAAFLPVREFREQTERFCVSLTETAPAAGFREVLVPGDPEQRILAERLHDGIPVTNNTWHELNALLRS
ncbi:Ldh family oxidoreductase [Kibdelosporangium persicum]|uniref:Sulfolactate dehydrogenase n=1 Tax=Kibdelosporangium persicum TaxID=2698649 RepID=A0ABX2F7K5_9PSEU|nr:Ldh family oxidoreductase [Kibdelosporangium persicum]NRN67252.1 Sulfolactate dehydrogenase [Kibdelosporangium persicum]